MKANDFQELVDREFASLSWTEQQRLDTLRQMNKEEHPIMKRKVVFALVLIISVMAMSAAALAVTLNITPIVDFFASWDYLADIGINEEAIVSPRAQRHTSQLMDITVEEMYLTDKTLYFTLHFTPKDDRTLLFPCGSNSIEWNGKTVRYYDLWDTDLTLLQLGPMEIDDLNTRNPIELMAMPTFRQERDGSYTLLCSTIDEDTVRYFWSHNGGQLMLRFYFDNCRNIDREWNVVLIDLPAITKQPE